VSHVQKKHSSFFAVRYQSASLKPYRWDQPVLEPSVALLDRCLDGSQLSDEFAGCIAPVLVQPSSPTTCHTESSRSCRPDAAMIARPFQWQTLKGANFL